MVKVLLLLFLSQEKFVMIFNYINEFSLFILGNILSVIFCIAFIIIICSTIIICSSIIICSTIIMCFNYTLGALCTIAICYMLYAFVLDICNIIKTTKWYKRLKNNNIFIRIFKK